MKFANIREPAARTVTVSNAGCSFFNGVYSFAGSMEEDAYVKSSTNILYQRLVPRTAKHDGGKLLTLALEETSEGQRWTICSEMEMDVSGTRTSSVVYYQNRL